MLIGLYCKHNHSGDPGGSLFCGSDSETCFIPLHLKCLFCSLRLAWSKWSNLNKGKCYITVYINQNHVKLCFIINPSATSLLTYTEKSWKN